MTFSMNKTTYSIQKAQHLGLRVFKDLRKMHCLLTSQLSISQSPGKPSAQYICDHKLKGKTDVTPVVGATFGWLPLSLCCQVCFQSDGQAPWKPGFVFGPEGLFGSLVGAVLLLGRMTRLSDLLNGVVTLALNLLGSWTPG